MGIIGQYFIPYNVPLVGSFLAINNKKWKLIAKVLFIAGA